ncbi:MAG: DNA polymerase III subunit gamma/tau [Epsilonproteobacteria bacterium]|nr:DNA polymerase III subunit gamma/tau [Campylobacterota bacterium]NPA56743.1 DNA polymerase III subunit gamma/tau [Campylobacterota bacterium]
MTLALKYRPKRFEDLIGQESVVQTLTRALDSKKLGHAYLFSGLRGSGKTSTARIFAKALLCQEGPTSSPCDLCPDCVAADSGRHIDIIEMDAASNRKIDDIRELIEHTKYRPSQGRYKIFIIDEVHMLTKEAFNALLKTLEEPPEFVKFILATTDPLKLPVTILSRTQHFRFKKIAQRDIIHHLERILALEGVEYETEALAILARSGGGSLRDTLTLLDQAILFSKSNITVQSVSQMLGLIDPERIRRLYNLILSKDREGVLQFVKENREYQGEMIIDEMVEYLKEEIYRGISSIPLILQERFFRILSDAKQLLFISGDDEFVLTLTLLKMVEATKVKSIDELIKELEEGEKQEVKRPLQPSLLQLSPSSEDGGGERDPKELFQELIRRLYRLNHSLGECFERSVTFLSFDGGVLTWESHTPPECREKLRLSYGTIKHLIRELFGIDTKIKKVEREGREEKGGGEGEKSLLSPLSSQIATVEGGDILNDPLVQEAKELFRARRITIKERR